MTTVVGIRFKKAGKIYYFSPGELNILKDDNVIVETIRGIEFGKCVIGKKEIPDDQVIQPLKDVIRIADKKDVNIYEENKKKAKDAFKICAQKIVKHKLDMKLIDTEYTFDNNKIIFYFTAEGRVDFRELVKDLASVFRTRIELRQIGVRDEAKMIGGFGPCGRVMCCARFLGDFAPVSIKMAKEQNLSLNPSKISGMCGRLMCCLNYEQKTYEDIRRKLPKVGSIVKTPDGEGEVTENNIIKEQVKVKIKNGNEEIVNFYPIKDTNVVSGGFEGTVNEDEVKKEVAKGENADGLNELLKDN